jgi:hypothetical protein
VFLIYKDGTRLKTIIGIDGPGITIYGRITLDSTPCIGIDGPGIEAALNEVKASCEAAQ